jgi:hypothetical protein
VKYRKFVGAECIGDAISMISSDELDVALVKNVVPPADCIAIQKNFFGSEHRRRRPDNVPGYILGATHYSKTPAEYFMQCSEARASVSSIFENTIDPMRLVHRAINEKTRRSIRPSRLGDREALHARAVEWLPDLSVTSEFLLRPHEDFSQIDCSRNEGWEVRDAKNVMAINFYASADAVSGRLRIYDYIPDTSTRDRLELQGNGYPYPLDLLENKTYIELAVETSDMAIINGKYIHAVTSTRSKRVVINCFVAQMSSSEYVYWT